MKKFLEVVKLIATKGVAFLPLLKILANPKVKVGIVEIDGGVKLSLYLENITKQEILDMIEELRK
jgi:hypothetical protein